MCSLPLTLTFMNATKGDNFLETTYTRPVENGKHCQFFPGNLHTLRVRKRKPETYNPLTKGKFTGPNLKPNCCNSWEDDKELGVVVVTLGACDATNVSPSTS